MTAPALQDSGHRPPAAGQEWRLQAACLRVDPDLFFPHPSDAAAVASAIRVCRSCPVVWECFDEAMTRKERHGIWGGCTPWERGTIRRRNRKAATS